MNSDSGLGRAALLDSFFTGRRFALALGLLLLGCFAPVLLGFQSFMFRDFGLFGHPLAFYARESFWRGEIPLWNPLNNCGLPFMAQWNTMVFYPFSLIYLLLPLPWSLNVFCLFHLYAGGLGMFLLARRWTGSNFAAAFAGTVFALNGLALHCLMWPNNIAALGWMPWILLTLERAWTRGGWFLLPAVLAGACQFLTGAPEAFVFTWSGGAVIWLAHAISNRTDFLKTFRSLIRFTIVVLGVVALSAVQLLPLLELIKHSQRSAAYDTGGWAMPPWGWMNLLVPLFRTTTSGSGVVFQLGQAWTSSYYFGIAIVWLALLGIVMGRSARVVALAFLVVAGLVLALGDAGYVWTWIKYHVGALGFMRYPIKLVFLIACPLTLLAAFGVADLLRANASEARRAFTVGTVLLVTMLLALGGTLWFGWNHPLAEENRLVVLFSGVTRALFLIALSAGLWFLRQVSVRRALFTACVWCALVAADFLTHTPWQNPTVNASLLAPSLEELRELRQQTASEGGRMMPSLAAIGWFHQLPITNMADRYVAHRFGISHNLNLLEGIPKAEGFFSLYIAEEFDVQVRLFPEENSVHEPIADAMGITRMTAPGKTFEWFRRTNALPIVSVGQQPVFLEATNILNTMLTKQFDPHATVLLASSAPTNVAATRQPTASLAVESFRAGRMEARVTTPAPTMMTISQSHYPPWKAYVDDAPVTLWRANHAFQAVEVPAGEHRVRLQYEDRMFRIGAVTSGVLLLLIALALLLFPACRQAFRARDGAMIP